MFYQVHSAVRVLTLLLIATSSLLADPCGMVPPIYRGDEVPITRVGEQQTYAFYKDGVETFVIRPGFSGKVDEFGMLIPFPTPPAIRKVPDHIFSHIAAAVDPPEVVVNLLPRLRRFAARAARSEPGAGADFGFVAKDEVRVLREEAVGMYEVAVLEAGSADALKRWMDERGYQYPKGMDKVCNEYIDERWCFVAVKTKVGQKPGVDPRPGQRTVNPDLPAGSTFDGFVQAMGFRFKTDEIVIPMRLSAFNKGKLRNVVYLLTDKPSRIRDIPEEFVVRQIAGKQLFDHLTQPLPLRIIGGDQKSLGQAYRDRLKVQRDPHAKNGAAKELFAADLLAVSSGELSLPHEEREKELLRIGERLGLRGSEIDRVNHKELKRHNDEIVRKSLHDVKRMTLSVIDGDFPRDVIASDNLKFAEYIMPAQKNDPKFYDAIRKGPAVQGSGTLIRGALSSRTSEPPVGATKVTRYGSVGAGLTLFVLGSVLVVRRGTRKMRRAWLLGCLVVATLVVPPPATAQDEAGRYADLLAKLEDSKTSESAIQEFVKKAGEGRRQHRRVTKALFRVASTHDSVTRRGWAITALSEIGGQDVDEMLLKLHADDQQSMLVRTWAAAGRVAMARSAEALIEKAQLIQTFPALGRPIGMRLVQELAEDKDVDVRKLLQTTLQVPQLQQSLAPAILAQGSAHLVDAMLAADDQNVRRQAAAYLGTLASQGDDGVPQAVIEAYEFDPEDEEIPWQGGPLFVPGIAWEKSDARVLAGNLIAWHVWCDRQGKSDQQRQIHNNLRSLGLANAAGYQSPGFREVDSVEWLRTWGKAFGKKAVREILEVQGAAGEAKYRKVLDEL